MAVLRLSRSQYRTFAEQAKAVGRALNVASFERNGRLWGECCHWALLVCDDATSTEPTWKERAMLTLSSSINADVFRAAGMNRPELDQSVLEDHEIYPFILHHEIGHRQDNFDWAEHMLMEDLEARVQVHRQFAYANEILADRYAWRQIRPGESLPLNERGRRDEEKIAACLEFLEKHVPKLRPCRPESRLAPGDYRDVPDYMLATPQRAAFLGPRVNKTLVSSRTTHHKRFREEHGRYLWEGTRAILR